MIDGPTSFRSRHDGELEGGRYQIRDAREGEAEFDNDSHSFMSTRSIASDAHMSDTEAESEQHESLRKKSLVNEKSNLTSEEYDKLK